MVFNADKSCNLVVEKNNEKGNDACAYDQRCGDRIINILLIFFFLDEPEICSFEAKNNHRIDEWNQCIHQVHLSIIGCLLENVG